MMENRFLYIDAVCGIMIIHMIAFHIFHAGEPGMAANIMRPLSFFMFYFFYKSGMMYKDRDVRTIFCHGVKKMLVPFVVFSLLGYLVWLMRQMQMAVLLNHMMSDTLHEIYLNGVLPGNIALWFLPSLLVVQLIFKVLQLTPPEKYIRRMVYFVCLICFCLYMEKFNNIPCYFKNIPLGLSAYIFGFVMRKKQYNNKVFGVALMVYIVILCFWPSTINFMDGRLLEGNYLLAIVFAFSGCIVINNLFVWIMPNGLAPLNYIGRCSMDFYTTHMIILTMCLFVPRICVPYLKEIQCVACIICLPMFSFVVKAFKLEWIFGRGLTKNIQR